MWVMMVQHKTSDQYLTSGKVSTRSSHGFKRYRLLKTLTKNFNILSNADADTEADAVENEIHLIFTLSFLHHFCSLFVMSCCLAANLVKYGRKKSYKPTCLDITFKQLSP